MDTEVLSQDKLGETLEWSALEYEEKDRSADWFWALGVIIIASALSAIIFGNYFFAMLIILSGILMWFFALRKPDIVYYELNAQGLKIRTRLYPYENIKSFWIQVNSPSRVEVVRPLLFIKSERLFMPIITIPIDEEWAEDIQDIMISHNIPEEEMREHVSEKIMELLGF